MAQDPARVHAIVGDGITAAAFLEHGRFAPGDHVLLIGPNARAFGRGVAYAGERDVPWRYAYLLNSPADDIDPAFARWLAEHWERIRDTMEGRTPDWLAKAAPLVAAGDVYGVNAPREIYGDFMEEQVAAITERLRIQQGVTTERISATVTSLSAGQGGLRLRLDTGEERIAARADIAPGGPSTMRFEGDDGPFAAPMLFGYEPRIAEHIRAGAEIFCIGGNASMLDTMRLCQTFLPDARLRFVAMAPDGAAPPPLIPRLPRKLTQPALTKGHATAASFLAEIRSAIDAALAEGDEMREIRAGFRAYFLAHGLQTHVTDPAEARRVPATLRFWLRGGTRDTILDFNALAARGITDMRTGSVTAIEHGPNGARVHYRDAEGQSQVHETGFVVNCAGAGPTSRHDPLTEDLLAREVITRCPVSRGLVVGAGCQTALAGLRYLSPAVTVIGEEPMAMPLYDAHMLRTHVARACA